jgi:predicted phage gp36 major capsid-like protein
VSRFEKPADFVTAYPHAAPSATTIKTLALLAALLAYAAGFVVLYPLSQAAWRRASPKATIRRCCSSSALDGSARRGSASYGGLLLD